MSLHKIQQYRNPQLLRLANGMPCMGCGCQDGTIVMAHSDFSIHGKAKGMKAHDCFVAALCHTCHTWLGSGTKNYLIWEAGRSDKLEFFRRAHEKTMLHLWGDGLIKVTR